MATVGIATYNIHRCVGTDRRYDPARVIRVLEQMDCGIVALQEVENRADAMHESLQLDHLATALKMQAVPGLRIIRRWGEYGNALLTRYPVRSVSRHSLSISWFEPRGLLEVEVDVHGQPLRIFATHLGLGRIERRYQTMQLVKAVEAVPADMPCLVLGDMNEWFSWSRHLTWLHDRLGQTLTPATFPSAWPFLRLDRIWLRPRSSLRSLQAWRTAESRVASDHLPLKAVVELGAAGDRAPAAEAGGAEEISRGLVESAPRP